jgi:uncharacterized membrane protein
MAFAAAVEWAGTLMEAAGTATMIAGAVAALALAGRAFLRRAEPALAFRSLRQNLGRAILLGLEFLVAADIIRTVSTVPTLGQVAVLGGIVLIRTFLSFTLEVELEGRWPWQRRRGRQDGREPGPGRPYRPAVVGEPRAPH